MIERTYLSKFNTIIEGQKLNTGINPVAELSYGTSLTRILCYFDTTKIKNLVDTGIFADISKVKHTLHITNAGSIDFTQMHCREISSINSNWKKRASSFDIIFFLIPKPWDRGKGFDYTKSFFNQDFYDSKEKNKSRLVSEDGCNWYQARNGVNWDEDGIYSIETLSKEYDKFSAGEKSIVFARQHFDLGTENISIDITDIFNKFMNGELDNYGIGIAYSPMLEETSHDEHTILENYTGFLTDKTNTFFEPYVETVYDDHISDDRANFILDKHNKLYLYCNIGGKLANLDENPTCSVDGKNYEVKNFSKGIYYIDIMLSREEYEPDTMVYDVWDNIKYEGKTYPPVELDVTLKNTNSWFNVGNSLPEEKSFTPSIVGIQQKERILRGDIRKVGIVARVNYTKQNAQLLDSMYARLYVLDGEREIDVIKWEPVNKTYLEDYIIIDTNMLVPQRYYMDVKINYGMQETIHHNVLTFDIVSSLNNKYA